MFNYCIVITITRKKKCEFLCGGEEGRQLRALLIFYQPLAPSVLNSMSHINTLTNNIIIKRPTRGRARSVQDERTTNYFHFA